MKHKEFWWLASYSILYSIGSFGVDGITTLYGKMKLDANEQVLGQMGSLQGVGSILGALLAAVVIKKIGIKYSALILLSVEIFSQRSIPLLSK